MSVGGSTNLVAKIEARSSYIGTALSCMKLVLLKFENLIIKQI